jgi:hypothetical protein
MVVSAVIRLFGGDALDEAMLKKGGWKAKGYNAATARMLFH